MKIDFLNRGLSETGNEKKKKEREFEGEVV
jgi:hypothetical protein